MKTLCKSCNSINAVEATQCHGCGKKDRLYDIWVSDSAVRPPESTTNEITFEHNVTYYVPVYQKNYGEYPTLIYSMADAQLDEEMAYSMNPDYVLVLTGHFNATTKRIQTHG